MMDDSERFDEKKVQQITGQLLTVFTAASASVGFINTVLLLFFFMSTKFGDMRGTIKDTEKVLLYSVIAPDALMTLLLVCFICPATYTNSWFYSSQVTVWLGYLFLVSVLHAPLAMGAVCSMVVLSITDSRRYVDINKRRKLIALCVGYGCLTCCFCSLPATENAGFVYNPYWFFPMMSVKDGFGGVFAIVTMASLILFTTWTSLVEVFDAKTAYSGKKNRTKKITKKVYDELSTTTNFVGLCLVHSLVLIGSFTLPIPSHVVCFGFRMIITVSPTIHVLLITKMCPHFKFKVTDENEQEYMSEFVELGDF